MGQTDQFSQREKEVSALLIQGKTNKEIALALDVAVRTVEFHLSNIYAKLGVSSRTEAALMLADRPLRESTGEPLRESTGHKELNSVHNGETSISKRRFPMKKLTAFGLLTAILVSVFAFLNPLAAEEKAILIPTSLIISSTPIISTSTATPHPTISAKEPIVEQIRQLVAEYDQAVQAEKQNGEVELKTDPTTGEELFFFTGDSFFTIMHLEEDFWENIHQLNRLYLQVYREELEPTPFPTQATETESQAFYESLVEQTASYCEGAWRSGVAEDDLLAYRATDGKYLPIGYGDTYARCELYGQMIEEWRVAPDLEKVDQETDIALIRQITGKPELPLAFQNVMGVPNAFHRDAVIYTDESGTKYYVDIDTTRLAAIEPNFPGHPNISAAEAKSMDELRGIARQFAITNSLRLGDLETVLLHEENCKDDTLCFFRWDYRNKDWNGTDWFMMPPFLQVGVLKNGQIATYNNTLDLFE